MIKNINLEIPNSQNLSNYTSLIKDLNIDENLRAENLSVKDYCNISLALNKKSFFLN